MRRIGRISGFPRRPAARAALVLLAWTLLSGARTEEATGYTKTQAYNGALRFLRVEQNLQVTEKDADLGYMLFEYPTGMADDTTTGSVEVIERDDEVLVVVQISELPAHHESRLAGALLKKLEADYGVPRRRAKDKPPSEAEPPPPGNEPDDAERAPKAGPRQQQKQ